MSQKHKRINNDSHNYVGFNWTVFPMSRLPFSCLVKDLWGKLKRNSSLNRFFRQEKPYSRVSLKALIYVQLVFFEKEKFDLILDCAEPLLEINKRFSRLVLIDSTSKLLITRCQSCSKSDPNGTTLEEKDDFIFARGNKCAWATILSNLPAEWLVRFWDWLFEIVFG